MIKHVGRHNTKRVVIAYKQVPDEEHMCLVIYSELLPSRIHDEVMKVLESEVGQQANEFADALFRHTMADGTNCLNSIHRGGLLSKVPTNQVIVTPTSASSVRLDELNTILAEIAKGAEATKKLEKADAGQRYEGRELGEPTKSASGNTSSASVNTDSALSDTDIANQRIAQAAKMRADAQSLLAEATRLESEATAFAPIEVKTPTVKKTNVRKSATKKTAA